MQNKKDGPRSGPSGNGADHEAKAYQKKQAELAASSRVAARLFNDPGYASTTQDAIAYNKIIQKRAQQTQHAQPAATKPRDDPPGAQTSTKENSDASPRQRNQENQPNRYDELRKASQMQQASNGNKGQGRSGSD